MIVPMKKVTLICMKSERELSLVKLRELGIMHISIAKKNESEELSFYQQQLSKADKALSVLAGLKSKKSYVSEKFSNISGEDICALVIEALEEESALNRQIEILSKDYEKLLPWGNFSTDLIKSLKEKGFYIYLCTGSEEQLKEVRNMLKETLPSSGEQPDDKVNSEKYSYEAVCEIINEKQGVFWFVVISRNAIDLSKLPLANVNQEKSLNQIISEKEMCENSLKEIRQKLNDLTQGYAKLEEYCLEILEKVEFFTNRDIMEQSGEIVYLKGFVPDPDIEKLSKAAKENGWALLIEEPSHEDNPPTKLHIPKIFRISKPIFDFMGIVPGYKEWDVSACFLIFFSIFFGMIVGDAGYGCIFLALSVAGKVFLKEEKYKLPLNLALVLSSTTIIWGALTATWFGIKYEMLPSWLHGWHYLANPEIKNQYTQYICFLLAAIQLSFARVWKASLLINSLKALGQLGWALLIWGNFFTAVKLIVFPHSHYPDFAMYMYIIGFILIVLFYIDWKDIGNVLNFPFTLIGSFVDVLSYIRLFAVGLSTYYIANSFNNMGLMLLDIPVGSFLFVFLLVGMILIIVGGHILNILLALVAVLVHGIRLNTLEFSNHMELTWAGIPYKPFKKLKSEEKNEAVNET